MKKILLLVYSSVLLISLSCKKFLEVDLPIDQVTSEKVFENDETATSAVLGIYSQMMPTSLFYSSGGTTIYTGIAADELFPTNTSIAEVAEFYQNNLTPANGTVWLSFWQRAYKIIYQANICIEKISLSETLSIGVKERLLGEAKFIRAFTYFNLVNLFGDVPLVLATGYKENATMGRTPTQQVWTQIINDLKDAKQLLPIQYPDTERVRPNKWAATALLARAYLYNQQWKEAEAQATEIINSGTYSLLTNLNNVFLNNSNETLWQLMPVEAGFNTTEARSFVPTGAASNRPSYALTNNVISTFETGDKRRTSWIGTKTVASETFFYPFKYKIRNLGLPITEYYMVLRYAEVLLIRAEARAQQNKITEAKADVNAIRIRAGLTGTTANNKNDLLEAIERERRVELFAEWGHRWFDLKRTGKTDAVLSGSKPFWQATDVLFPIPLSEILRNPALTQNPGY